MESTSFSAFEGREDGPAITFGQNPNSKSLGSVGASGLGGGIPAIKSAMVFSANSVSSGNVATQLAARGLVFANSINSFVFVALGKR
jgi:hypothetical protein